MPTCDNKTKPTSLGSLTAAELDHHASEAAKVKRTKEQAYFNSYDFDAIEVLPYDEDDDRTHPVQHQHHQHYHHGSHSAYHPSYAMGGGCKACHLTASQSAATITPVPAVHHSSHNLNSRPHHFQKKPIKAVSSSSHSNISHSSSNTTTTTSSNLSSFSHPSQADSKRTTYLKRIGAFFTSGKRSSTDSMTKLDIEQQKKQKQQAASSASSSSQHSSDGESNVRSGRLYDVNAGGNIGGSGSTSINNRDHVVNDTTNSNFLLPRAMLKYQSTGFGNSMPLSIISNLGGGSSSSLKSNSINSQLNITANAKPTPHTNLDSSIAATETIPITNGNLKKPPPNHIIATKTAVENSGFTSSSSASSSVSASSSSLAKSSSLTTNSSLCAESSSIIGETNASAADVSADQAVASVTATAATGAPVASKSITNSNAGSSIITSGLEQSLGNKLPSSSSSSSETAADMTTGSATTTTSGSSDAATAARGSSSRRGGRERTSSQSHYSTDKSGSSGYYSSNVCSTYSVEDHIYCEPVIDILEVGGKSTTLKSSKLGQSGGNGGPRKIMIVHNSDDDDEDHYHRDRQHTLQQHNVKRNLRILETSIENLDRHLKNYPKLNAQDRIASFVRLNPPTVPTNFFQVQNQFDPAKNRYGQLPTILEGGTVDGQTTTTLPKSWRDDIAEDSLLDIDLDSFLLVSEGRGSKNKSVTGIDNPTFDKSEILHDEDMENNYKCVKYINSCPEDAYKLESEMGNSVDHFLKKYEDQIHFQNTRELLEDVRDKIRLLSESAEGINRKSVRTDGVVLKTVPKELESMIEALKSELETYLERMNHHSEMEIRQLCTGLVKNQNIVKMKKAFERRKSNASESEYDLAYEAIRDGGTIVTVQHTRQQIETTSIRCTSDPNFKMKRKSLCEIFPSVEVEHAAGTSTGTVVAVGTGGDGGIVATSTDLVVNGAMVAGGGSSCRTQLQKNLSFHKPILNKLGGGGEAGGEGDKDSILDWHRKKPSIWEMYYGTNRMNQTLLGKRGVITNGNQAILSYPSSRPESDFTLDLPRAEQLRIKMEKEKKFRRRCRYLTTFLSLVFFLLTVMVVSLVLTRGKRMFGSMI